jgi:hypothetical protein
MPGMASHREAVLCPFALEAISTGAIKESSPDFFFEPFDRLDRRLRENHGAPKYQGAELALARLERFCSWTPASAKGRPFEQYIAVSKIDRCLLFEASI